MDTNNLNILLCCCFIVVVIIIFIVGGILSARMIRKQKNIFSQYISSGEEEERKGNDPQAISFYKHALAVVLGVEKDSTELTAKGIAMLFEQEGQKAVDKIQTIYSKKGISYSWDELNAIILEIQKMSTNHNLVDEYGLPIGPGKELLPQLIERLRRCINSLPVESSSVLSAGPLAEAAFSRPSAPVSRPIESNAPKAPEFSSLQPVPSADAYAKKSQTGGILNRILLRIRNRFLIIGIILLLIFAVLCCVAIISFPMLIGFTSLGNEIGAVYSPVVTPLQQYTATVGLSPEASPTLQHTATAGLPSSVLFQADFNDPAMDGTFDPSQWVLFPGLAHTEIKQKNGMMTFSKTSTIGGENALLRSAQSWSATDFRHLEARLKLDKIHTGTNGNIAITFSPLDWDTWWEGCGIQLADPAPFVWCGQASTSGGSFDYMSQSYYVEYNEWHTIALDINPRTAAATFYLDGQSLHQWQPANASRLTNSTFSFSIGLWMMDGTALTGYADDVKLTR